MNGSLENDQDTLRLQQQLKRAVESESPPPYLEAKIWSRIHASERPKRWQLRWAPLAAALTICLGAGIAYQVGYLRWSSSSQEAYIATVSNKVATLLRVGLRDHLHCSVFRKYPKNPPKVEELMEKLGPEYGDLIPIVRQQLPENYRMMIAHECSYHGRKFVHLSLKNDSRLLSLVIARKQDGESFETEQLIPALAQSGILFYRAGSQRFQVASFESREHLVYFVSDLPQSENLRMMLAIAPQVKEFLDKKAS